jgi:hypothetical protein
MTDINLGLSSSLLEKIRYSAAVARGSLTSQGTPAPDPSSGLFSRSNYKETTNAFNGGGWIAETPASSSVYLSSAATPSSGFSSAATPSNGFNRTDYTQESNQNRQTAAEGQSSVGRSRQDSSREITGNTYWNPYRPGVYPDQTNRLAIRPSGSAFFHYYNNNITFKLYENEFGESNTIFPVFAVKSLVYLDTVDSEPAESDYDPDSGWLWGTTYVATANASEVTDSFGRYPGEACLVAPSVAGDDNFWGTILETTMYSDTPFWEDFGAFDAATYSRDFYLAQDSYFEVVFVVRSGESEEALNYYTVSLRVSVGPRTLEAAPSGVFVSGPDVDVVQYDQPPGVRADDWVRCSVTMDTEGTYVHTNGQLWMWGPPIIKNIPSDYAYCYNFAVDLSGENYAGIVKMGVGKFSQGAEYDFSTYIVSSLLDS